MDKGQIDFYQYGTNVAHDIYRNQEDIANQIEEQYGKDARLEFECGALLATTRMTMDKMEEKFLKKIESGEIISGNSHGNEELRNNSYFGYRGSSSKTDETGKYKEPGGKVK